MGAGVGFLLLAVSSSCCMMWTLSNPPQNGCPINTAGNDERGEIPDNKCREWREWLISVCTEWTEGDPFFSKPHMFRFHQKRYEMSCRSFWIIRKALFRDVAVRGGVSLLMRLYRGWWRQIADELGLARMSCHRTHWGAWESNDFSSKEMQPRKSWLDRRWNLAVASPSRQDFALWSVPVSQELWDSATGSAVEPPISSIK